MCRICGIIQRSIETIIEFQYAKVCSCTSFTLMIVKHQIIWAFIMISFQEISFLMLKCLKLHAHIL